MLPASKRTSARPENPAVALPGTGAGSTAAPLIVTSAKGFGIIWLATLIGCAVLFEGLTFGWINDYQKPEPAWMDIMYRQKELAMARRAGAGHRLVVVGGSGTLFGIDGELLEKKLGVPTVNFGTHAGLGLRYLIERAQKQLQPGDTVLLAAEYMSWIDNYRDRPGPALWYMRTYDKRYLLLMNPLESQDIVWNTPLVDVVNSYDGWKIKQKGQPYYVQEMSPYCYAALSPNGDQRVNLPPHANKTTFYCFPDIAAPSMVESFTAFSRYAQERGVRLLITCPNFVRPETDLAARKGPPAWAVDLWSKCGWTVLDTPSETAFPLLWFMDSDSHPNPICRRIRTERLVNHLRPFFGLAAASGKPNSIFLMAGTDQRLTDGNAFANDPDVQFRYLRPPGAGDDDPAAITAEQVAVLVRGGTKVLTDSQTDATALLAPLDLGLRLSSRGAEPVAQWFNRYNSNVICIAAAPDHAIDQDAWRQSVSPEILRKLAKAGPTLAVFGVGRQERNPKVFSELNCLYHEFNVRETTQTRKQPPLHVALQSLSKEGGGPFARIEIDYKDFLKSPSGICIAALDPEMGIVVGQAIYRGGPEIETWRLFTVVSTDRPTFRPASP